MPLNCASVRRTSQARIGGEWGVKGWGCRRRGRLIDSPAHLRLVPERRARGVQRGLLCHCGAKRCPRISRWWARPVGLQDFHRDDFGANLRGRAVKTVKSRDACAQQVGLPSAMRSSVDLRSGASCGRSARAPAHLEASHSAMPNRCTAALGWNMETRHFDWSFRPPGRWPMLSPKAVSGDYACPAVPLARDTCR